MTADHGGVGANGRAAAHERPPELLLARHVTPGIDHVREHHRRAAEDVVFEHDSFVDRHVVLDLHVVANRDVARDEYVLAEGAEAANRRARHDMAVMPDFGALADGAALVDRSRRVREITHGSQSAFTSCGGSPLIA